MNKKINFKIAMILLATIMFIVLSNFVLALGIAPAKKVIDFEPGLKTSEKLLVINNEHKEFRAIIYAKGELEKYITFKESVLKFSADESQKEIGYEINLPENIGSPGKHSTDIIIMELPEKLLETGNTFISTTAAVISQLTIDVPYPGKYVEGKLSISEAEANEQATFTIQLYNFGVENVEKVKAKIEIFGPTNERVGVVESNEIALNSRQEDKLIIPWTANVNPGIYHAVATIDYDGSKVRLEQNFDIGSMLIEVRKIEVKDFKLGEVARFDLYLENRWNEKTTVYGEIEVMDKKGETVATFKTASLDIAPMSEDVLRAYWDTEGIAIGTYDIKIVLHYSGKTTEKLFEININIDSITTMLPTGRVIEAKEGVSKESVLILLVIALVIINIGWLIYLKKRKKS